MRLVVERSLAGLLCVVLLAGCSSRAQVNEPDATQPAPVRVLENEITKVPLGDGAILTIPVGAMPSGTTVTATRGGDVPPTPPDGGIHLLGSPVNITADTAGPFALPVTLEFPAPDEAIPDGVDPATALFIATFDELTHAWVPLPTTYDAERKVLRTDVPHFTWFNPATWLDWTALGARVNQDIGELLGRRAGAATCPRKQPVPSWVREVVGVTNDAGIAVRGCIEGEGDVLVVELVNNRPYGMMLTYGSGVKWGWHETGGSAVERARNTMVDRVTPANQLYLPPLSRASVGIPRLSGSASFAITITRTTITADLAAMIFGETLSIVGPYLGCATLWGTAPVLQTPTPSSLWSTVRELGNCVVALAANTLPSLVASGALDQVKLNQIRDVAKALSAARLVGTGIQLGTALWPFADLYIDSSLVKNGPNGAGFTVFAKSGATAGGSSGGTGGGGGGTGGGGGGVRPTLTRSEGPVGFFGDVLDVSCPEGTGWVWARVIDNRTGYDVNVSDVVPYPGHAFTLPFYTRFHLYAGPAIMRIVCDTGLPDRVTYDLPVTFTGPPRLVEVEGVPGPGVTVTVRDRGGCPPFNGQPQTAFVGIWDGTRATHAVRTTVPVDSQGRWGPVSLTVPANYPGAADAYWAVDAECRDQSGRNGFTYQALSFP